jgi:hypothetical protein
MRSDPGQESGFFQRLNPDPVKMGRIRHYWILGCHTFCDTSLTLLFLILDLSVWTVSGTNTSSANYSTAKAGTRNMLTILNLKIFVGRMCERENDYKKAVGVGLKRKCIFQFLRKCENQAKMGRFSQNFTKFHFTKIFRFRENFRENLV